MKSEKINRFDIIVYKHESENYVHRVIGVPGNVLSIKMINYM
ncbi:S26 family signal peptidase [Enterococcus termitis]|nr:hypothetical protein RV18_GL003080 [Enterococcus termitis]